MLEENEKNLPASPGVAYDRIRPEPDMPEYTEDEILSRTLFNRWRNEARFIRVEAMQQIWGNILAQEIIKPGSISLRTLDAPENVSAAEAEVFCQLCDYVINDDCFLSEYLIHPPGEKAYEIENNMVLEEIDIMTNIDMLTTKTWLFEIVDLNGINWIMLNFFIVWCGRETIIAHREADWCRQGFIQDL